jgi:uncharacterized protein
VLRVTADTNIFIPGLNFTGIPRQILNLAESGAIHLAVSEDILDEVTRVLGREKFGWPQLEIDRAITQISRFTERVESKQRIDAIVEDPTDNRILECAVAYPQPTPPFLSRGRGANRVLLLSSAQRTLNRYGDAVEGGRRPR